MNSVSSFDPQRWNGALLVNKPAGISSFGVVEKLKLSLARHYQLRMRDLPKLGHGGTLDPFATGLLIVLVGKASKLSRYLLESQKHYQGTMLFGQTTVPGDPTEAISERCEILPQSLADLQKQAIALTRQGYLQTPPMHSAKKHQGQALYKLARQGIEVEREAKLCHLYHFHFSDYQAPRAQFSVACSAGTYIRTLAQDFARFFGTVAMLETLERTQCGHFRLENSLSVDELSDLNTPWNETTAWVPFDLILQGYPSVEADGVETQSLRQGQQSVLFSLVKRASQSQDLTSNLLTITFKNRLAATVHREDRVWKLNRVF